MLTLYQLVLLRSLINMLLEYTETGEHFMKILSTNFT